MDPGYRPHGHTRSMSSLASTIVPVFFESHEWAPPTPFTLVDQTLTDIPDELRIPLPPSTAGSEYGDPDFLMPAETPKGLGNLVGVPESGQETLQAQETNYAEAEIVENIPGLPSAEDHAIPPVQASIPIFSSSNAIVHSLIQILREDAYESGRFENLQTQIQDLMSGYHVTGRLISRQLHLYRMMLNCLKSDDSAEFASLYSQAVRIQELQSHSHHPPRKVYSNGYNPLAPFPGRQSSWLHTVSPEVQRGIVHVIRMIRSDPKFLAGYLTNVSSSHLNKLALPHRQSAATESVLRNPTGSRSVAGSVYTSSSKSKDESGTLDHIEHDTLFLLINCVFQISDDPGSMERHLQCDVWSTICAQIVEEGKADSDEFCLAVLDIFATMDPWLLKPQLETFLKELIQSGTFVLEPPANQVVDFKKPAEISENPRVTKLTGFFENALKTLTQLLTSGPAENAISKGVLNLIHSTLSKIGDPVKRTKARKFFLRWYCTSYISNALVYPESIGIMMEHHISKDIRQKIFHELAARFQRSIFDVLSPWKPSTTDVEAESEDVSKLLGFFDPTCSVGEKRSPTIESPNTDGYSYLTLSMKDVLIILNGLHPSHVSQIPLKGFFGEPIVSKASSITGSSTLTSGTDEPRTGTASSTAVSEGGTSMTSDGSSTQMYLGSLDDTCSEGPQLESYLVGRPSREVDESFLIDEHHMDIIIRELSSLVDSRNRSIIVPGSWEEDFVVLYTQNHGEALSLEMNPLDKELNDANVSLEALAKDNLEPRIPSQDHLEYLVEGLVRLSQADGMSHGNDEDKATDSSDVLEAQFRHNMVYSESCYDYQTAHFWWKCIEVLGHLSSTSRELLFADLTTICRIRIETSRKAIMVYEKWCAILRKRQISYNRELENLAFQCRGLRDKMWYLSGVKYSSTYQDAINVTRALRSMAKSAQAKATGVAAWARQRLRSSTGSDRAQQQTLEVLAAPKEYGGPAKMSDEQVEMTSRWLTRYSVENFCKGEERIHRFCLEIQKCVNKLVGETLLDSPVLWSSALYQYEKQHFGVGHGQPAIQPGGKYQSWRRNVPQGSFYTPIQSAPYISDPSRAMLPSFPPNGTADSYYPRLSGLSPSIVPSNEMSGINQSYSYSEGYRANPILPPSPLSPTFQTPNPLLSFDRPASTPKQQFLNSLKDKVISLLLSELGSMLWNDGSETDCWINERRTHEPPKLQSTSDEFGSQSAETTQKSEVSFGEPLGTDQSPTATVKDVPIGNNSEGRQVETASGVQESSTKSTFTFYEAYRKLFRRLSLSTNPYDKLRLLYEITTLIAMSQEPDLVMNSQPVPHVSKDISATSETPLSPGIKGLVIPRTRLTRLEEVMANCEERRLQSIKSSALSTVTNTRFTFNSRYSNIPRADLNTLSILQSLLLDPLLYPPTLFRDLQYIAAFVPSSTLDASPLGTAFWTFGLAAITLKSTLSARTTHRANLIVAHHYSQHPVREHSSTAVEPRRPSLGDSSPSPLPTNLADDPSLRTTTLADAARLYTLSALEGDPTAARELALFHLTHPELVRRVTLPFSRPAEVFRAAAAAAGGKQEGMVRGGLDPMAFAVAFHWMEVAANAGDKDAKAFLRENGDLGRGW